MTRLKQKSIAFSLTATMLLTSACGNKTAKHKLAIFTADTDAALVAVTDSIALFQANNRLSPAAAKSTYQILLRLAVATNILRDRAKSGFSKKEALTIADQVLADVRAAEAAGVINLTGKARTQFLQITFFAQFAARSIKAILEAAKQPELPPDQIAAAKSLIGTTGRRQVTTDETLWTDLVLIAQVAAIEIIGNAKLDEQGAFDKGTLLNSQLQASLNAKIAAIP